MSQTSKRARPPTTSEDASPMCRHTDPMLGFQHSSLHPSCFHDGQSDKIVPRIVPKSVPSIPSGHPAHDAAARRHCAAGPMFPHDRAGVDHDNSPHAIPLTGFTSNKLNMIWHCHGNPPLLLGPAFLHCSFNYTLHEYL
jgi:hypothetical protein